MWKDAIKAIKTSDDDWIAQNRRTFSRFFEEENEKPAGKLPKEAMRQHYQERLFKMFLSKAYNGAALSLREGAKRIENSSVLNPSWGWLLAIGVGGAYFADYMTPEIARKYFLPGEALVAGSGKPNGNAKRKSEDRWEVSGSWRYCSGSEQASLFTAVTEKEGKMTAFILPVDQGEIERDWNAIGLKLTCSHTVVAEQAEIPSDHFFDLSRKTRPSDYPLATYPFMSFARICFVPVILGITRAFLMELQIYLGDKKDIWTEFQPERYTFVKNNLTEATQKILAMRSEFYQTVETSWENHLKGKYALEEEVGQKALHLVEFCYNFAARILPRLGMAVLEKEHPLQKLWQDLQTARQHGSLNRI